MWDRVGTEEFLLRPNQRGPTIAVVSGFNDAS
jgi:hypothetical protein